MENIFCSSFGADITGTFLHVFRCQHGLCATSSKRIAKITSHPVLAIQSANKTGSCVQEELLCIPRASKSFIIGTIATTQKLFCQAESKHVIRFFSRSSIGGLSKKRVQDEIEE